MQNSTATLLGRSLGEGKDYPLEYSGRENSMYYIAHRIAKSWTWLSSFHFGNHLAVSYNVKCNPWASQTIVIKISPVNAGDVKDEDSIPGLGKYPGEGHDNPLQCSGLENPKDSGAWRATVHSVTKSQTNAHIYCREK